MRVLVSADDTGGIKEVCCNKGTDSSKKDAEQAKWIEYIGDEEDISSKSRVMLMSIFQDKYLICVRLGGSVSVFKLDDDARDTENKGFKLVHTYSLEISDEKPISLVKLEAYNAIIVAFSKGSISLIKIEEGFSIKPIKLNLPESVDLEDFVNDPYEEGIFAYGGKECDVKLVRLFESKKASVAFKKFKASNFNTDIVFKAKNVKNDHLNLRVPVWITKIQFFKERKQNSYVFVTATGYGQIRTYDTVHGRRPVADYQLCKTAIRNLAFADEKQQEIIITDKHNLIAKHSLKDIDMNAHTIESASAGKIVKPSLRLLGKFSEGGNTGAIKSIHVLGNYVACGGLDRYLRVFDVVTRELIAKVYIGVEITSTVLLDVEDEIEVVEGPEVEHPKRKLNKEEEEEEDEELWNQLNNETEQTEPKRRKL